MSTTEAGRPTAPGKPGNQDGVSLQAVIESPRRLDELSCARIVGSIADAAHAAHKAGKPLAALTPAGVLVRPDGSVALAAAAASLRYTAPEQLRGGSGDRRSDVFVLGVMLWEALAHERLFDGRDDDAIARAVREAAFRPPSELNANVPAELDAICRRALARDPAERYQSAKAMAAEIDAVLGDAGYPESSDPIAKFLAAMTSGPGAAPRTGLPRAGTPAPVATPALGATQVIGSVPPPPAAAPSPASQAAAAPSSAPAAAPRPATPPRPAATEVLGSISAAPQKQAVTAFLGSTASASPTPAVPAQAASSAPAAAAPGAPGPSTPPAGSAAPAAPPRTVTNTVPTFGLPAITTPAAPAAASVPRPGTPAPAEITSFAPPAMPAPAAPAGVSSPRPGRPAPAEITSFGPPAMPAPAAAHPPSPGPSIANADTVETPRVSGLPAVPPTVTQLGMPPGITIAPASPPAPLQSADPGVGDAPGEPRPVDPTAPRRAESSGGGRDVLAGWGWSTDSVQAIADDNDDFVDTTRASRRRLLIAIGGALGVVLTIVILAFSFSGSPPADATSPAVSRPTTVAAAPPAAPEHPAAPTEPAATAPAQPAAPPAEPAAATAGSAAAPGAPAPGAGSAEPAPSATVEPPGAPSGAATPPPAGSPPAAAAPAAPPGEPTRPGAPSAPSSATTAARPAASEPTAPSPPASEPTGPSARSISPEPPAPAPAKPAAAPKTAPKTAPKLAEATKPSRKAEPPRVAAALPARPPADKLRRPMAPDRIARATRGASAQPIDPYAPIGPAPGTDPAAAYRTGLQQYARGDTTGALATFRASAASSPGFAPTWRGLGLVYEKVGSKSQARQAFRRYLQLAPNASDAEQIRERLEHLGS